MAADKHDMQPPTAVEDAPDPDEDDLDDLDEMLEEFAPAKANPTPRTPSTAVAPDASGPGRPSNTTDVTSENAPEEDFAKELQAGMADMLRELKTDPEMASQFEAMLAQFGALQSEGASGSQIPQTTSSPPAASSSSASAPSTTKPTEDNFQDTIRRTMERMKESSDSAGAAAAKPPAGADDMMANLLRELQDANGGPNGEGDDTFSKMLLGMMEQLTNKEILYEPMKELDTKFPAWLEEKGNSLSEEDRTRYTKQKTLVRDIVSRFERSGYSDGNPEDREYIVERMQEMQAAGAPPPDLVGDVNAASNFMNDIDTGCPQQ